MSKPSVFENQTPLRAKYKSEPQAAMVTDHALARGDSPSDPFHSTVRPLPACGAELPVGVHRGVGGLHDAPTPGDILCAALAACQDSTVRLVANLLGIELEFLEVEVTAEVDLRGAMAVERNVPVGFQSMRCNVRLRAKEGTKPELLERLGAAAERCCVVQQTLRNPPPIQTTFEMARP